MNCARNRNRVTPSRPALVCVGAVLLLSGCRHQQLPPQRPAVIVAPIATAPVLETPTMPSPPPDSVKTAPTVKVTQAKPKRQPKKTPAKTPPVEVAPPVETASTVPAPEASPVGALSTGGDADPQKRQEISELIASSEHRLEDLSKSDSAQQGQLRKVRRFLEQARQALGTGDAEAAKTLATKAKLLMDDVTK